MNHQQKTNPKPFKTRRRMVMSKERRKRETQVRPVWHCPRPKARGTEQGSEEASLVIISPQRCLAYSGNQHTQETKRPVNWGPILRGRQTQEGHWETRTTHTEVCSDGHTTLILMSAISLSPGHRTGIVQVITKLNKGLKKMPRIKMQNALR